MINHPHMSLSLFSVHFLWVLQDIVLFALLNQPVMLETLWTIVSTLSSSQRYLYRSPTPPTANMFDAIQRSVDKPSTETCAAGGSESLNRSISQYLCCLKILFSEPVRKWRSPSWDKVPSSTSITIHFSTNAIFNNQQVWCLPCRQNDSCWIKTTWSYASFFMRSFFSVVRSWSLAK